MNIQVSQLKYLLALVSTRSFSEAAEQCFVSQPALSMAIRKLEEELNITLFDRKSNPIELTEKGEIIVSQAQKIIEDLAFLEKITAELQSLEPKGNISLSIIPTLAPYLIPLFMKKFAEDYPSIQLSIEEDSTKAILHKLKNSETDVAILVTPIDDKSLIYNPLFYEEFYLYTNEKIDKKSIATDDIDYRNLWLLEEGHCMRQQMINICESRERDHTNITYNAGSIESLINITDTNGGMTIIPELAVRNLSAERKNKVFPFKSPKPVREISIMYHKLTPKMILINPLLHSILNSLPSYLKTQADDYLKIPIE
ncbi:MAG: hydrogen peroxide-inducible genes activator [Chitinophagales bacterium]|nr:hydrogen peroxide-inducible genes activator [Chitinophagales bacterium]